MVERKMYMDKIESFMDKDLIKIITGVRRSGKSFFLNLIINELIKKGVNKEDILLIDLELPKYNHINSKEQLDEIVLEFINKQENKVYLFFDEIQKIPEWQDAINSFRVDFECDIYITGSNAFLLSSEYATYLAGRSVEIKVFPLSFIEFIDFHGYKIIEKKNVKVTITFESLNVVFGADTNVYTTPLEELTELKEKFLDNIQIVLSEDDK